MSKKHRGPIGQYHALDNAVRAVENGFTLFRCSSGGVSGVWDGNYQAKAFSRTSDKLNTFTVNLPLTKNQHRFTLYPVIGYLFGLCLCAFAGVYLVITFVPSQYLPRNITKCFISKADDNHYHQDDYEDNNNDKLEEPLLDDRSSRETKI